MYLLMYLDICVGGAGVVSTLVISWPGFARCPQTSLHTASLPGEGEDMRDIFPENGGNLLGRRYLIMKVFFLSFTHMSTKH